MNDSKITVRYAKALFELSLEKGVSEIVLSDVRTLAACCAQLPDFKMFLQNPILKISEKKSAFAAMFSNQFHPYTLSILNLLVKNRRESFLPQIAHNYIEMYRTQFGYKAAIVTAAFLIDDETKERFNTIISQFFNTKIDLECKTNADVIGGFIIQIDDNQIDATVSTKLKKLRNTLVSSKN